MTSDGEHSARSGSLEDASEAAEPVNDQTKSTGVQFDRDVRRALSFGVAGVLGLVTVAGWLGYGAVESQIAKGERDALLQAGRETALQLTTVDHSRVETDVQRILDSATGQFRDEFESRSAQFIEVVQKAESTSEGTIVESGLESQTGTEGQVLVAVDVSTSNPGAEDQVPRSWRMRLTVQQTDGGAKVSKVEFVP